MKRPTPITAIAVSTAKPIANPIRSRLASDGLRRRWDREYACAPMADEATDANGTVAAPDGIDQKPLEAWFGENVPGVDFPLTFERIAGGHSNLTYRVKDAAALVFALRRPPLGKRLGSAHDMSREHKVVSALGGTEVPVAPVVGLCEDESVNDAPFYVMEFVEGPILRGLAEAEIFPDEGDRQAIGERVADTLVQIHSVDPHAPGLGAPRRPRPRRPRRPGPKGGLRRPPAAPLAGAVGEVEDARAGADRPRPRGALGTDPRAGAGDDRPRRLPPRQHDPHRLRRGRRGGRLGALHPRRPARRRRPADDLLARARREHPRPRHARQPGARLPQS